MSQTTLEQLFLEFARLEEIDVDINPAMLLKKRQGSSNRDRTVSRGVSGGIPSNIVSKSHRSDKIPTQSSSHRRKHLAARIPLPSSSLRKTTPPGKIPPPSMHLEPSRVIVPPRPRKTAHLSSRVQPVGPVVGTEHKKTGTVHRSSRVQPVGPGVGTQREKTSTVHRSDKHRHHTQTSNRRRSDRHHTKHRPVERPPPSDLSERESDHELTFKKQRKVSSGGTKRRRRKRPRHIVKKKRK